MNQLSWRAALFADGARGAAMQTFRCVEYPTLTMVSQRPSGDAPFVTTFHVDGIANHWPTAEEALTALLANLPAEPERAGG